MANEIIVSHSETVCIVGGGPLEPADMTDVSSLATLFVAADGGANHLMEAEVIPVAVIGDLDSLSHAARQRFSMYLHHIPEQETTDFEKALTRVDAPVVLALGFTGGRLDHSLAVLNVMARFKDKPIILVSADDATLICPQKGLNLSLPAGTRVSLMPMASVQVTTGGLRWPLIDAALHPARKISIANEATGGPVRIISSGPLLVSLPRGHLGTAVQSVFHAR